MAQPSNELDDRSLQLSPETRSKYRVIIIGAGICGLATAIGLAKAGFEVTVLERSPELREIGAGIQIPPNACRVLAHLDLLDAIQAVSVCPQNILLRSYTDGSNLHTIDNHSSPETTNFPLLVTHRADLCRILYSKACAAGVKVQFDSPIQALDFDPPAARLASGTILPADLLICADGAQSLCRSHILADPSPPRPSGKLIYRFTIPITILNEHPSLAHLAAPQIHIWLGPNAHAVGYGLQGIFSVVLSQDASAETESVFDVRPGDVQALRIALKGWHPVLTQLLELSGGLLRWALPASRVVRSWSDEKGAAVLAGDAVHTIFPLLAQGAAMALESALCLSTLLSQTTSPSEIPMVLKRYESIRYPRCSRIDELSRSALGYLEMPDGPEQVERDKRLREGKDLEGEGFALVDTEEREWVWGNDVMRELIGIGK